MKKIIAPILAAAVLLSGCSGRGGIYSNYRETEHLLPVQTLGLDSAPTGIRLSVSCAAPGQGSGPDIISRDGRSILDAMDSLQDYSAAGQLYYSHAQYVVLGEDYARAGVGEALDFLARDGRMRMGLLLFVAREDSAQTLVTGPGEGSYDITGALASVHRDTRDQGTSPAFTARETIRRLSEGGAALVCAVSAKDTEGSVFLSEAGKTAVADGYAIIKNARLLDFLDTELAAAASLLLGHSGTAAPVLKLPEGGEVSLRMDSAKAKISPRWEPDGTLAGIDIHAELEASLAEIRSRHQNITDKTTTEALEMALEQLTQKRLEELLDAAKELDADFLDLMAHLRQHEAAFADALPEDWLKNTDFSVSVEAEIKDAGDMGDMMNSDGWGN